MPGSATRSCPATWTEIKSFAADAVVAYPALLAVVFFFAAMLLYSQAATAKAITPAIVAALGISAANPGDSDMLVASFAAVSALFVLPTYPTLLGAVQMDDTGTTRIGKYVFNHAFFIPGLLAIVFSVCSGLPRDAASSNAMTCALKYS